MGRTKPGETGDDKEGGSQYFTMGNKECCGEMDGCMNTVLGNGCMNTVLGVGNVKSDGP